MKKMIMLVLSLFALVGMSACSYTPYEGSVTDKSTYTTMILVGKVMVPQMHYSLTIDNEESWDVQSGPYNACHVGDMITRTEDGTITCTSK